LFATSKPHMYVQTLIRFMKKVTTAIPSSMNVGQSVAGVTHGCTFPAMIMFFVRKYLASVYERSPIVPALITSERDRVTNRRIRIRFLYAWDMDQYGPIPGSKNENKRKCGLGTTTYQVLFLEACEVFRVL
jgi:hypothetical protein